MRKLSEMVGKFFFAFLRNNFSFSLETLNITTFEYYSRFKGNMRKSLLEFLMHTKPTAFFKTENVDKRWQPIQGTRSCIIRSLNYIYHSEIHNFVKLINLLLCYLDYMLVC